jgi:hypothetical protein
MRIRSSCEAALASAVRMVLTRAIRLGLDPRAREQHVAGVAQALSSRALADVSALIYELLDAHDDTSRLATDLTHEPDWCMHLDYLRQLQRVSRETLAHLSSGAHG